MPYGQQHYPFENKELFMEGFPADFIAEGLAIVSVMILISFAIWLMMIIFKRLMALIAAITLHELKTQFLTIYAWSSCVMSTIQYLLR